MADTPNPDQVAFGAGSAALEVAVQATVQARPVEPVVGLGEVVQPDVDIASVGRRRMDIVVTRRRSSALGRSPLIRRCALKRRQVGEVVQGNAIGETAIRWSSVRPKPSSVCWAGHRSGRR